MKKAWKSDLNYHKFGELLPQISPRINNDLKELGCSIRFPISEKWFGKTISMLS